MNRAMRASGVGAGTVLAVGVLVGLAWGVPAGLGAAPVGDGLLVAPAAGGWTLSWPDGVAFYKSDQPVTQGRVIEVPGCDTTVAVWAQTDEQGVGQTYYAVRRGPAGEASARARSADYALSLMGQAVDPRATDLAVPASWHAGPDGALQIVQLATPVLPEYLDALAKAGASWRQAAPGCAGIVEVPPAARAAVAALPFVRWMGPYHPGLRVEPGLRAAVDQPAGLSPTPCNLWLAERGLTVHESLAGFVEQIGGQVVSAEPAGRRMVATLTGEQLRLVAQRSEVLIIDRVEPISPDMNIARELSGANYVELQGGYTGLGVRGEVHDTAVLATHCDFQAHPILFHTVNGSSAQYHGTAALGIVFGDGTCNATARGMVPDGSPIFAAYSYVTNRMIHSLELVDPLGPYRAVFQTSSVGSTRTTEYTTISAEMDDILMAADLLATQSQSNAGNTQGRPEAWAKNIVSVGGVNHYDTLTTADDCWCYGASIGPASDGRVKPDFTHFYDDVFTATSTCDTCYDNFGGSSAATPIVAGCFGLFFQMWADGLFGNPVNPKGDVFDNRAHMTTAKAMLINTARQYPFTGTSGDLTRMHQGWGLPDLATLYDLRNRMLVVDETDILQGGEVASYPAAVVDTKTPLRVTLTYADPPGVPYSNQHRINDLSLRVVSPSGTVYWGNEGLLMGNWSKPGGAADTVDTVECVFVAAPEPGVWMVEVQANEVNADSHLETPQLDADFALVISGIDPYALAGDCNVNGGLDLGDAATHIGCLSGPGGGLGDGCACADLDGDGDADMVDVAWLMLGFDG